MARRNCASTLDSAAKGGIDEVIIALGTDVEDATGHYLAKRLAKQDVEVSRIARSSPAGTGLEYADELTLSQALEGGGTGDSVRCHARKWSCSTLGKCWSISATALRFTFADRSEAGLERVQELVNSPIQFDYQSGLILR